MIGAIENGILAVLRAYGDAGALGYRFRSLETYPEDWDEYLKEKVLQAPAAHVVFAGFSRTAGQPLAPVLRLTFGLVLTAENLRNETAQRHGGPDPAIEPGSYQLAWDAMAMLAGNELGLPIGPLEIRSLRQVARFPAIRERKIHMLALELTTDVQVHGIDLDGGELPDFALFNADWDLPPFGNVDADPAQPGVQLPAGASADATDQVHLETSA